MSVRFASRAYRGTRNLRAVQMLLGHASIVTTERYTAVDDMTPRSGRRWWPRWATERDLGVGPSPCLGGGSDSCLCVVGLG